MSEKTSIVFFGNEKLATGLRDTTPVIRQALEKADYDIEAHVLGKDIPEHKAKVAVLAAYGKILPQRVLNEFPLGIINVHPSLLPQYRGPTPIEQAILDGAAKTGVSIMRLGAEMDAGPIYKQKSVPLSGNESKGVLAKHLQLIGAELLLEVLPGIVDGNLSPRQQPHPDRATYCQLIQKSDGAIDWTKPAVRIAREIRAYSGWPRSYTKLGDIDVIISEAHVSDRILPPGSLLIEEQHLIVGCGEQALEIKQLQPAGKKEMLVTAFLAGYKQRLV